MSPGPELEGPERPPASGRAPSGLVVMLHGVGADGNDLIELAGSWQRLLPECHFIAPHAPERYDMAPIGYQWFSLRVRTPEALLDGLRRVAPVVERFLDAQLARFGLDDKRLALVGFSQGAMVSLYVAPRRPKRLAGVVGYSGALVGMDVLAREVKSKPPILLVHGDRDELVPLPALHGAVAALGQAGLSVEWHVSQGAGHGIAPDGLRLGGAFLARVLNGGPS
ncbi:MAG TPA: dienelactone hydrolase family protein [Alphaproteobacteria bacterium]|nr:dienelactone hydrolase family protein [Alphaproteobacteria bacterium]